LTLAPGETLYLFSDGVTEAHDPAGVLFSEERLEAVLRAAAAARSRDVVEKATAAVKDFVGSALPSDDITMLALRRVDASAI
jgi:serine phosphatase RsbU (regulator of sigma subunit)